MTGPMHQHKKLPDQLIAMHPLEDYSEPSLPTHTIISYVPRYRVRFHQILGMSKKQQVFVGLFQQPAHVLVLVASEQERTAEIQGWDVIIQAICGVLEDGLKSFCRCTNISILASRLT